MSEGDSGRTPTQQKAEAWIQDQVSPSPAPGPRPLCQTQGLEEPIPGAPLALQF